MQMRAWTVDADDIRVAEDFDEAFLHRTPEIDTFLASDRDDKFIVIGTKGFGKTLLLKAKRILYQRTGRGVCLPTGSLLDKPIGDKIFSRETLAFFAASPLPWAKVWLAAIALTALKHVDAVEGLKVNARLMSLLRDRQLGGVIDHFVRLLDFSPGDLQRCATDTDGHLVPRLRAINAPLTVFIDGIDEYFNKHVEGDTSHSSVSGELSPNVWYFAQLGLVEVAYQLRRVNHHLKVFAAIRKEAYASLPRRTAMAQQYRGSAIDIFYSPESLREIFVNNVRLVKPDRMVRPARVRNSPLEAFFGLTSVTDTDTQEEEAAPEGGRSLRSDGDRARVSGRDRPLHWPPRFRRPAAVVAGAHPHARRDRRTRARRRGRVQAPGDLGDVPGGTPGYRAARSRARRMAPALPASGRSHAGSGRPVAPGDALSRAPGAGRCGGTGQSGLPAAGGSAQRRRLRPPLARPGREGRFHHRPADELCAQGTCMASAL
jgi:hypothetical protein